MSRKQPIDRSWIERSKNVLAQGYPGTNSKRWNQYVEGVFPSHSSGIGMGAYLLDAWGNRYLDFIGGLGSLILGYSHAKVVEAVQRQAALGASHSLPTTLEVEVAEHLTGIVPAAKRIRFLKTGNEAALAAVRIARAVTKRPLILSQGYHGHGDLFTALTPPSLGIVDSMQIQKLPFYELPVHEDPKQIAGIIVEALYLEASPGWQAYLQSLREFCTRHGILLIFDEIITGFRVPDWTVSKMWSIEPDIILLGKAIANGWPLSVVAGKAEVMDACDYFISSTFSGEATSLAACLATMREIEQNRSLKDLFYYGNRLQEKLNQLHPSIKWEGYGTRAMLNVTNPFTALFMQEACKAGILFGKAHFFNFAHLEANIEEFVLNICGAIVRQIEDGKVKLEGFAPEETFKR